MKKSRFQIPTDKIPLMKKFPKIPDDYEMLGMTIRSEVCGISLRLTLLDFDASEMRAIRWKRAETGFLTAEELMRVQQTGRNRPKNVSLKRHGGQVAMLSVDE